MHLRLICLIFFVAITFTTPSSAQIRNVGEGIDHLPCEEAGHLEIRGKISRALAGERSDNDPWCPGEDPSITSVDDVVEAVAYRNAGCETIRRTAAPLGIDMGVAIEPHYLTEPGYARHTCRHFNSVTPENAGKWLNIHPMPHVYDFTGMDRIAAFAEQHQMQYRFHALIWHLMLPMYIGASEEPGREGQAWTTMERDQAIQNHIFNVMARYRDGVARDWDVVNEPFTDNGSGFRPTPFWLEGEDPYDYIAYALTIAHAVDPDARLCINDFSVEELNLKSTRLYNLVLRLRSDGVPIHCVGLQGHFRVGDSIRFQSIAQNLQRFAELGLDVQLTELDARICGEVTATKLEQQAAVFASLTDTCFNQPRCSSMTWWGLDDAHSWIDEVFQDCGSALLFDNERQPKPALWTLHETLRSYQ